MSKFKDSQALLNKYELQKLWIRINRNRQGNVLEKEMREWFDAPIADIKDICTV